MTAWWYCDNSQDGDSLDVLCRCQSENLDAWAPARAAMTTFWIAGKRLNPDHPYSLSDRFLIEKLKPVLDGDEIELGFSGSFFGDQNYELYQISRLVSLGLVPAVYQMQSALSKLGTLNDWKIAASTRGASDWAVRLNTIYPALRIGINDSLVSHADVDSYKAAYQGLWSSFADDGIPLDHIVIDNMSVVTAAQATEARNFINSLGVQMGIIVADKQAGNTTDQNYKRVVLNMFKTYRAADGDADIFQFAAWFPCPADSLVHLNLLASCAA